MSGADRSTDDLLLAIDVAERLMAAADKLVMANQRSYVISACNGITEAWYAADQACNQARNDYVTVQEELVALKRKIAEANGHAELERENQ